jgi:hypothetical protein
MRYASVVSVIILFISSEYARSQSALSAIQKSANEINGAGRSFNISPRLIACVIYSENLLNVTWKDRDVDPLLARYGLDVSLGLGQVKVSTAQWIETALHERENKYYIGSLYSEVVPFSPVRDTLIKRLLDPDWNTKYVAAYLAMIRNRWKEAGEDIGEKADILATLYSAGVIENGIEKRAPHADPRPNEFGNVARSFYLSDQLIDMFPRP